MAAALFGLFSVQDGTVYLAGPWIWLLLLAWFVMIWNLLVAGKPPTRVATDGPRMLTPDEQPEVVRQVMNVRLAEDDHGVQVFRGSLREPSGDAFAHLKAAFLPGAVPLLQRGGRCPATIVVLPREVEQITLERPRHKWLHWGLLALTLFTTTWAGAAHEGVNLLNEPGRFATGLPYAIALMTILGVHELGHFATARLHGMNVSPPYFVPAPFALGTFGAFIRLRSPSESRRALLDVAIAGPLAGLLIAIPVLWLGLRNSTVLTGSASPTFWEGTSVHSSLLFAWLARLSFGDSLPLDAVVKLSPLAFAGWLGLFITGLNLLPVGQLDGGHIARAMVGTRAGNVISGIALWSLVLLGLFVWSPLLTWAILVFLVAGRGTPPLNDVTPIGTGRMILGGIAFVLLVLVLLPVPVALGEKIVRQVSGTG